MPVTELHIRADWQLIRVLYLPAAGVGLTPVAACAFCHFFRRWAHHAEEWFGRKPLFRITATGLQYEDGGRPSHYGWGDIEGVILFRKNRTPFWRTNGNTQPVAPAFWLAIDVREKDGVRSICVWPRQVRGGLMTLTRFAKELQRNLVQVAKADEIPNLLPSLRKL